MSACRRCGHKIFWAVTDNGKAMPIDPAATHDNPNLGVWKEGETIRVSANEEVWRDKTTTLTTSHFATCPFADQERHKRGTKR